MVIAQEAYAVVLLTDKDRCRDLVDPIGAGKIGIRQEFFFRLGINKIGYNILLKDGRMEKRHPYETPA
jgi:hypothetical protein